MSHARDCVEPWVELLSSSIVGALFSRTCCVLVGCAGSCAEFSSWLLSTNPLSRPVWVAPSLSGSSSGRLLFGCSRTSSWGWSVLSLLLLVKGSRLSLHFLLVVRLFLVLRLGLVLRPDCLFSCCRGFSCSALKGGMLRYLAHVCSSSSSARSFTFWPLVSFAVLSL